LVFVDGMFARSLIEEMAILKNGTSIGNEVFGL